MNLPFSRPVSLESELPPEEIVRRLREVVGSPFQTFAFLGQGPRIVGRVKDDRFWLRYSAFYNNSFQRRLVLAMSPSATGTLLRGRFACSTPTIIFSGFWFGLLALFNVIWLVNIMGGSIKANDGSMWMNFIPIGMLVFGAFLVWFGLWLSSRTEAIVLEFVERTLNAKVTTLYATSSG